ncbi:hypothetical protein ABZP36_011204 [Zizania latifolia]
MVTLQPGEVYTESQLLKELETLVSCVMFKRVDLEGKAKPDGILGLTVSFIESVWSAAKQFKSIVGSVTSSNLLNPQDDLIQDRVCPSRHPYLDGMDDRSKSHTFKTSCFNTRKLSSVFIAGLNMDEAPPVWVDRVGFKANITDEYDFIVLSQ